MQTSGPKLAAHASDVQELSAARAAGGPGQRSTKQRQPLQLSPSHDTSGSYLRPSSKGSAAKGPPFKVQASSQVRTPTPDREERDDEQRRAAAGHDVDDEYPAAEHQYLLANYAERERPPAGAPSPCQRSMAPITELNSGLASNTELGSPSTLRRRASTLFKTSRNKESRRKQNLASFESSARPTQDRRGPSHPERDAVAASSDTPPAALK